MIPSDDSVRQAVALARAGKTQEARAALVDLVKADEDNIEAWAALAQIVETPRDAAYCLNQILRIQPDNEWARTNLQQLSQLGPAIDEPSQEADDSRQQADSPGLDRPARARNKLIFGGTGVIAILGILGLLLAVSGGKLLSSSPLPATSIPNLPTGTPSREALTSNPNAAPSEANEQLTLSPAENGSGSTPIPDGVGIVTPTVAQANQTPTPAPASTSTLTQTPALTPTDYPTPTDPPDPQDAPTNVPAPIAGPCNCYGASLTCRDFDTQAEAQACYTYCRADDQTGIDIFHLDTNNNDIACEELP